MLISVEGQDGVGKSIVVEYLSKNLNIPSVKRPIDKLLLLDDEHSQKITEKIHSEYSSDIQAMYYLMGYLSVLEDSKKTDLLLDRGFLSTYYFSCNNNNNFLFDMFAYKFGLPDITIVLHASVQERINRIRGRNPYDVDLNKKRLYIDGYNKFFEALSKYNVPYLLISNENLSIDQTCNLVFSLLKLIIEDNNNLEKLKNIFSIDNLSTLEKYSYDEIMNLVNEIISKKKIKELKKEKNKNEKNSY